MRLPVNDINVRQKYGKNHKGIDFGFNSASLGKNQPIYATEDGVVIYNRYQITGGYVIQIRHDNGYVSEYGHLKKNSQLVREGHKVKKGQQIASMGNSGMVTGYHLHYALYKGTSINYKDKSKYVDPTPFLCKYKNQQYRSNSLIKNFAETKIATGIPDEPLLVRDKKGKRVEELDIYNGNEVETFGMYDKNRVYVDNIREYKTYIKYLK